MKRIRAIPEPGSFAAWIQDQMELIPTIPAFTIAHLAGMQPPYFSVLRSGKKKSPSAKVLRNVALAFAGVRRLSEVEMAALVQEAMRFAPQKPPRKPEPVHRALLKERERIRQTCHGFDLLFHLGRIDAELDTERRRVLGW